MICTVTVICTVPYFPLPTFHFPLFTPEEFYESGSTYQ